MLNLSILVFALAAVGGLILLLLPVIKGDAPGQAKLALGLFFAAAFLILVLAIL